MHLPLPGESVAPFKSLIIWDADVQTPTGSYQLLNKNTFSIDSSSHNSPKECSAAQAIWQLGHTTYFSVVRSQGRKWLELVWTGYTHR